MARRLYLAYAQATEATMQQQMRSPGAAQLLSIRGRIVMGALASMLALAGCMPIQPLPDAAAEGAGESSAVAALPRATTADVPLVVVQVSDVGVEMPAEVPSGAVAFRLEGLPEPAPDAPPGQNDTMEVVRAKEGVSAEQLKSAFDAFIAEGSIEIVDLADFAGLTSAPGIETMVELTPGTWYISRALAPGGAVLQPFTVVEVADPAAPVGDVTLEYLDFSYGVPETIPAGPQLWEVTNNGGQEHMVIIVQLPDEAAAADPQAATDAVISFMSGQAPPGPPPFLSVNVFEPISEGLRAWVQLDLAPGTYALTCPLPNVAGDMTQHLMLGMRSILTVTAE
jgi:hypothetical protein